MHFIRLTILRVILPKNYHLNIEYYNQYTNGGLNSGHFNTEIVNEWMNESFIVFSTVTIMNDKRIDW